VLNKIKLNFYFIQLLCYGLGVRLAIEPKQAAERRDHPLLAMSPDDLDFIVQFVLASGSLKDMAQLYGVSYPTIRASLDRVIATMRDALRGASTDEMTELLAQLVERGELKPGVARNIRALHRKILAE
jgi:hypothetical protein